MRIGYLTHEPLPSSETSTEQLVWTVSMLAREGLNIDLVFPKSRPVTGETPDRYRDRVRSFYGSTTELLPESVGLVQTWSPYVVKGDLKRAIHDLMAPFHARRYDVAYTRDLYALSLTLLLGIPSFFETYRTDLNVLRRFGPFRRLAYGHRHLLGVVTHSRLARDYFAEKGVDESKTLVAHNGYSPTVMQPVQSRGEARAAIGVRPDIPLVCYTGHVNPKKGVDILVAIAQRLPRVEFLLVGAIPGSESESQFLDLVRTSGADNVRLLPRVPPPEIRSYLYAADCLIIPPTTGPLERFGRTVLPMKTYLYLAAGRVIVAPDLPDLREVLTDGRNALLVRPDDVETCADIIAHIIQDRDASERLGQQARTDASAYTWASRGSRIADFVRRRTQGLE